MVRTGHCLLALSFVAVACREVPEATSPTPPRLLADAQSQLGRALSGVPPFTVNLVTPRTLYGALVATDASQPRWTPARPARS